MIWMFVTYIYIYHISLLLQISPKMGGCENMFHSWLDSPKLTARCLKVHGSGPLVQRWTERKMMKMCTKDMKDLLMFDVWGTYGEAGSMWNRLHPPSVPCSSGALAPTMRRPCSVHPVGAGKWSIRCFTWPYINSYIYIYYVANKYLAILDQTNNSQRYRKDDESPSISSIKDHKSPIKSIHVA